MAVLNLVLFISWPTIGKIIKKATALIAIAGSTTKTNSSPKSALAPKTKIAVDKKTVPETNVPTQVSITATGSFVANLFSNSINPKNTNAVTDLSIIFGRNPPGNVENRPDMTPVETPSKNTLFTSGNSSIPMNIIVNIKSGFIPPLIPGIIMYSTAPTPINRDINTKFFVFNSHLSSSFLSSNCRFPLTYPHDR